MNIHLSANRKCEAFTWPVDNIVHLRWMDCVLFVETSQVPIDIMVPGYVKAAKDSFAVVFSKVQIKKPQYSGASVGIASPANMRSVS